MISLAAAAAVLAGLVPVSSTCDPEMRAIKWDGELRDQLLQRSLQIVRFGFQPAPAGALTPLVFADAAFTHGINDALVSLGKGAEGAQRLAEAVRGMTYVYSWQSGLPHPADGCSKQVITVQFIAPDGKNTIDVSFQYLAGKLTSATGQTGYRKTGSLDSRDVP